MTTTERVALYARISEDERGNELGVTRQLEDTRALADGRGWAVAGEFSDNDISASHGAHLPGYEMLMKSAEARDFDRIVVFHTSRLWRNRLQRVQGMESLQKAHVSVSAVKGPDLDFGSASGRMIAGVLGEFDVMESEVKSERVVRAARQRAERGEPNGAVPYGWARVVDRDDRDRRLGARDVLDPETAPVVREVCTRLLAGQSLHSVTDWLNDSGVPAPGAAFEFRNRARGITNGTGVLWGKTSVKKLALRATNAGLRLYHAGLPDEEVLEAKVEPIITRDEWETLRAMLTAPARQTSRPGGRKHLLTWGIGECGVCGGVLRTVSKRGGSGRGTVTSMYLCEARECVGRNEAYVDQYVSGRIIDWLTQADLPDVLAGDDDAARVAMETGAGLRARLDRAADEYASGNITMTQLRRITDRLTPEIADADRAVQLARPTMPVGLLRDVSGLKFEQALDWWSELGVDQQRALAEAVLEKVAIKPVTRRGPGFDPNSVDVVFKG